MWITLTRDSLFKHNEKYFNHNHFKFFLSNLFSLFRLGISSTSEIRIKSSFLASFNPFVIKFTFVNQFSKEATTSLLNNLVTKKGFSQGMIFRVTIDTSETQRYSVTVWPNKQGSCHSKFQLLFFLHQKF